MAFLDGLLARVLRRPVERLVAEAMNRYTHGTSADPLYRYRVHGKLERLRIDPSAVVNDALFNVSAGEVTLQEHVFFGHQVAVLTGTHDITKFGRERQTTFPRSGRDVVIEEGVWVASHAVVLAPVRIGKHAVVASGSLVMDDVPPYAVVAGRPAKVIKMIDRAEPDAVAPETADANPHAG